MIERSGPVPLTNESGSGRTKNSATPVLRIRDVYPGSWFLPIPDPGSRVQKQLQKRGVKKISCHTFFIAINLTKLYIILFLKYWTKNLGQFSKNYWTFYSSSQKYGLGIRDPRSGIRKKPIPDPGSRGQKGTGSRIRIRNTAQHWSEYLFILFTRLQLYCTNCPCVN